jgi:hypothetical protein
MYIERQQLPAAGGWVFRNTTTDPNSFPDGVPSGSTWEYRVFDSVKGFDDSIEKQVLSPPSNVVQAQPLP